jgi:mTERF domain-containing protein
MFHLRKLISPSTAALANPRLPHIPSLHLLFSTAAPVSAEPFAVEDYLVTTCGLTRPQAFKASKVLSHLSSPSNSDAVLAFLSGLGLSSPDIAAVVSGDPKLLCANVDKNLARRVAELTDLGLSRPQISRLIPLARYTFRSSSLAGNLAFWLPVLGSFEAILKALKRNVALLSADIDKVAKPNLALLQQREIHVGDCQCRLISQLLTRAPKKLQDAVVSASKCGLPKGSRMFPYARRSRATARRSSQRKSGSSKALAGRRNIS